jgi:hypothetical protein
LVQLVPLLSLTSTRRENTCAGVNARFTKVFRMRSKQVSVFGTAVTRGACVATRLKINAGSKKSARSD